MPEQAARLREVGDWLRQYGQSIYSTRGGPYLPGDFGVSTYQESTIYLHILHLPAAGKTLMLPALPAKITGCSVMTGGQAECTQTVAGVDVTLSGNPDAVDTVVVLSLDSPAAAISPIATPVTPRETAPVAVAGK